MAGRSSTLDESAFDIGSSVLLPDHPQITALRTTESMPAISQAAASAGGFAKPAFSGTMGASALSALAATNALQPESGTPIFATIADVTLGIGRFATER